MGFFLGLVLFISMAGLGVKIYLDYRKRRDIKVFAIVFACVFALFLFIPFGFKEIKTGEIGVIKVWGEAREIKTAGLVWKPWVSTQIEIYDIKTQQINIKSYAYSQDAQTMSVDMTIQFRIQANKAIDINTEFGSLDILKDRINAIAEEKSKVVLSSQSAMQIIENRSTLSATVEELIKTVTAQYYIDVTMVVVNNIDFSDAFETVVENKMIAEQEKLKAQFEKEKALIKADEELEVAKKYAEEELERAKGQAQAQIEIATAQAESLRIKSLEVARILGFEVVDDVIVMEGRTPEEIKLISDYLKYIEYLNVWDGKLPQVLSDDAANILIPLS